MSCCYIYATKNVFIIISATKSEDLEENFTFFQQLMILSFIVGKQKKTIFHQIFEFINFNFIKEMNKAVWVFF